MSEKKTRIIIAGGGTGGHLFPGIAIAEEFLKSEGTEVLFVGVGNRLEKKVFDGLGLPFCTIRIEGVRGKGLKVAIKVLLKLPLSMKESFRIIRKFQPSLVMGVGGYVSGPVVLVASLMGIKTAVAEQNAFPGLTNRILGKFTDRIFLTYRESRKWFPTEKTLVTGNPVRAAFLSARDINKRADKFHILIFGGSQGARSINRIIAGALPHLYEILGASYFFLDRPREAHDALYALLRLDPDHQLDSFLYPPSLLRFVWSSCDSW